MVVENRRDLADSKPEQDEVHRCPRDRIIFLEILFGHQGEEIQIFHLDVQFFVRERIVEVAIYQVSKFHVRHLINEREERIQ